MLWLGAAGCASTPASLRPATYRVLQTHCESCDLDALALRLSGPEARDCGKVLAPEASSERLDVAACAQRSQDDGRPFRAQMALPGVDSSLRVAFARGTDGGLAMLWYDSDATGSGGTCRARVWRTPCARLRPNPRDPSVLVCEPLGEREDLCSEPDTRTQTWTDARDAGHLACESTRNRDLACEQRVTRGDPVAYQHCGPSRVAAWRCQPIAEPVNAFAPGSVLSCEPEGPGEALFCKGGQQKPQASTPAP